MPAIYGMVKSFTVSAITALLAADAFASGDSVDVKPSSCARLADIVSGMHTDETRFGGQGRIERGRLYSPRLVFDGSHGEIVQQIGLYLPARTAIVLRRTM